MWPTRGHQPTLCVGVWQYMVGFGPHVAGWQLIPGYVAFLLASLAAHEQRWLKRVVGELGGSVESPTRQRPASLDAASMEPEGGARKPLLDDAMDKHRDDSAAAMLGAARSAPAVVASAIVGDSDYPELAPHVVASLHSDFTKRRHVWDWVEFVCFTVLIKVVLVVLFAMQAFQARQTVISSGYFALSLFFLYNSKLLLQRTNGAFKYLQFFNYGVIFMQLVFQLPIIPLGCQSSETDICFSWQDLLGTKKLSAVDPSASVPSPFDLDDGLWTSLSLFVLALFQFHLYDSPRCVTVVALCVPVAPWFPGLRVSRAGLAIADSNSCKSSTRVTACQPCVGATSPFRSKRRRTRRSCSVWLMRRPPPLLASSAWWTRCLNGRS